MTTPASALSVRDTLRRLHAYVQLLCRCQECACAEQTSSTPLQLELDQAKRQLPTHLMDYIHLRIQKNPLNPQSAITTLTRKGCCSHCQAAVHPEWVEVVARAEIIYLCGGCGAVFVPASHDQDTSWPGCN